MTCSDTERLLELRASELLSAEQDAALSAHLAVCPACRAQQEALATVLDHARLPQLTAAEEARISELRRLHPVRPPARRPVLRWAVTGAAIAASALLGVRLGSVRPPVRHGGTSMATAASPSRALNGARVQDVDWGDDGTTYDSAGDTETDSALYDAVVFQGGVMPFDADNG